MKSVVIWMVILALVVFGIDRAMTTGFQNSVDNGVMGYSSSPKSSVWDHNKSAARTVRAEARENLWTSEDSTPMGETSWFDFDFGFFSKESGTNPFVEEAAVAGEFVTDETTVVENVATSK